MKSDAGVEIVQMPMRIDFKLGRLGAYLLVTLLWGCGKRGPEGATGPDVDPAAAAAQAMELYDANHDGSLEASELSACPPLALAIASYDGNSDGRISTEELSARLTRLYATGSALVNLDCSVTLAGQPLAGASVVLRPVKMFGASLPQAQGQTDDQGFVRPTLSRELLPGDLGDAPLMYPGLYHVEITHPQTKVPDRYNTATELGVEVDPSSRTGTSARFDLKSN